MLCTAAVQEQLQQNIRACELNYKNGKSWIMPQTIVNDYLMFGPPPSAAEFQSALRKILKLK